MRSLIQTFLAVWAWGTAARASRVRNNPLFGNTTLGYYYLEVFVGSQQSPQSLIVDTGSYSIVFPCQDCKECGKHLYPPFDSSASTTYSLLNPKQTYYDWKCFYPTREDQCDFFEGYVEGSGYTGVFGLDSLLFKTELDSASDTEKKAIFGCASEETNEFFKQAANGIIGLAPESKGFSKPPTILQIEQMEGRISQDSFSLCLGRNGGQIGLGGDNNVTHVTEKSVTISSSNLSWDEFYYVNLDGMKVGGKTVKYDFKGTRDPRGTAFLDSGTTFVYFGEALFREYRKQFVKFCAADDTNCGAFTHPNNCHIFPNEFYKDLRDFFDSFPVLELVFDDDKPVSWFPEDYLYHVANSHYYCVGIEPLRDVILGAIFVKNYDVLVNKDDRTVTFTRANCSQTQDSLPFITTDEAGYDPDAATKSANEPQGDGQSHEATAGPNATDAAHEQGSGDTPLDPDNGDSLHSGFSFVHLLFLIMFVAIVCCVVIWLRWVVMRFRETQRMAAQIRIEAQNIEQSAVSQESRQSQP